MVFASTICKFIVQSLDSVHKYMRIRNPTDKDSGIFMTFYTQQQPSTLTPTYIPQTLASKTSNGQVRLETLLYLHRGGVPDI